MKMPRLPSFWPVRAVSPAVAAPVRLSSDPTAVLPLWPGFVVAALVGFVYLAVASSGTFHFRQSAQPHHVLIADAWLHGQLHVRQESLDQINAPYLASVRAAADAWFRQQGRVLTDQDWQRVREQLKGPIEHDWSNVGGKYYGYWGPAPAALLLPQVALVGVEASDRLASAILGALTVLFMYLTLREVDRLGLIRMQAAAAAAVALLLGLGTVQFFLAVSGAVWFFSQIVAAFFLTLSLWFVFRIDRTAWWAVASGAALGGSILARVSEVFVGPFFLVAVIGMARWTDRTSWTRAWRLAVAFCVPVVAAGVVLLAFNHARFGSLFETGQGIQVVTNGNPRFQADYRDHGTFSLHYLPRNAYYYFANLHLDLRKTSGRPGFDPDGNSMFLVTPALWLAVLSYRRRNWLTLGAWLGCGACLFMLLCYFATGWVTFGNRYVLDFLPLAMVLVAAGMNGRLTYLSAAVILLSVAINAWGTYLFSFVG